CSPISTAVRSGRRRWRRLLHTLASNAVNSTPKGRLLVGCRRRGARLRIDVYDTGLGIPAAQTREIFKEFHRLDQGARVARGLGLGLSIVERIGRVLDHAIDVESNLGGGSHFSAHVPLATAAPAAGRRTAPQRGDLSRLAGMAILCIDNDTKILDGMEALLGGWGCRVLKARDLTGAIAAVHDAK